MHLKKPRLPRGLKYLAVAAGLLIAGGLVLVFVAIKTMDSDDYRRLAVWGVSQFSDARLVVDGIFEVEWSRTLRLTTTDIRFEDQTGRAPPVLSIRRLHVRIGLPQLMRGLLVLRELEIDGLKLTHVVGATREEPLDRPGWLLGILTPVVERLALDDLQFLFTDSDSRIVNTLHLQQLTLDDAAKDQALALLGRGRLNAEAFKIAGRMGGMLAKYDRGRPFPIDLTFNLADLEARLMGSIDHPLDGRGFNLKLAVEEQEVATLVRLFQPDIPAMGRFTFEASIDGDIEALRVTELAFNISNGSTIQLSAEGVVPDLATGRGADVTINQNIGEASLLDWLFPDDLKVVEIFELSAALHNEDGTYIIDDIVARVVNDKGVAFQTDGALTLGNPFETTLVTAVDLNLRIATPDTASIRPLLTNAIPEIGSVLAAGRLVGPVDKLALEDLYVDRGGIGPVHVTTQGRIGRIPLKANAPLEGMDLAFSIQAENSLTLRRFYEIPLGELGVVDLTGRVVGTSRRFKLQDVQLHTRTIEGLETHVTGGIDFAPHNEGGVIGDIDFKLDFSSPTLEIGEPLLGVQIMRPLGPIKGQADVTGTTEVLTFDNILVTGGVPDRLYAEWRGRVDSVPLTADSVSSGHHTYGSVYAQSSKDFAALFEIALPDVGPVRATWRDTDREGVLGMADIQVAVGDGQRFNLKVEGKVDNIIDQNKFRLFEEEEIRYGGVDFHFDLQTTDTNGIAKLIGMTLPDLGAVKGVWRLTGGESGLAVQEARIDSLSARGLKIRATGEVPHIDVRPGGALPEFRVRFHAQAPHLRAIPGLEDAAFPDLGEMQTEALLEYRQDALDLEVVEIRTGPADRPSLIVQGHLRDFHDPQRTRITGKFTTGARPWLENTLSRKVAFNPRMDGAIEMGRAGDGLRVDRIELRARELGGLVIEGAGTVTPTDQAPQLDFQIQSEVADPAAWGAMMDLPVPPLAATRITGWYRDQADQDQFTGDVRLGESRFQTTLRRTTRENKPAIEATLAAQTLRLKDLGFYPEEQTAQPAAGTSPSPDAPEWLFAEDPLPLAALSDLDLTLKILADRIEAREDVFNNVDLALSVRDGRLQVGPTTVKYKHGTSRIDAFLDANASPPAASLNVVIEDADLEEVLTSVDKPLVLGGQLSLIADLHSGGYSARELAANLSGEVAFAIESGRVQRKIELLASDALDFLFTGPAGSAFTDLDCAALRMFFQDGIGTIQVFFVETPGMRAEAFGNVDLTDETLALVINPTSKRRLIRRSSPVRVNGPLQDPSIAKVPAEEAAILAGQVLVPVVALPARALGILWSVISRDKSKMTCFIPPEDAP